MATAGTKGHGTTLNYNSELVGEIISVSGTRSRVAIPIHSCDTPNNAIEKISGSMDEGEITFTLYYSGVATGSYDDLNTDFLAGTDNAFTVTSGDGTLWVGTGIITGISMAEFGGPDDPNIVTLTIATNGRLTYTDIA